MNDYQQMTRSGFVPYRAGQFFFNHRGIECTVFKLPHCWQIGSNYINLHFDIPLYTPIIEMRDKIIAMIELTAPDWMLTPVGTKQWEYVPVKPKGE